MLATHDLDHEGEVKISRHFPSIEPPLQPIDRHGYQPPRSSRILGSVGTVAVCSLVAAGFLITLEHFDHPKIASAPLVVTSIPIASAEPAKPKPAEKEKPVIRKVAVTEPRQPAPLVQSTAPLPSPQPIATVTPKAAVDQPQPTVTATPPRPAPQAPPEQPQSSHGPDKWEGRVLARLERYRRYPSDAQRARLQGTAYIRFRIDRSGHVLSSSLERSSGYPALDEAAMDTLRRADPLPKIPPDRPDEVELSVPVEFFIK